MRLVKIAIAAALSVITASSAAFAIDSSTSGGVLPLKAVVSAPAGATGVCAAYAWACAPGNSNKALGAAEMELISQINRKANTRIRPVGDMQQYHVAEKWTLPTARGGDCEDYALYKKKALIEAGISPDRLLLASVLDRQGGSHAVLVLRADGADLVLDNLRGTIKRWDQTGYTFLRMQDPRNPQRWVATMAGGIFRGAGS